MKNFELDVGTVLIYTDPSDAREQSIGIIVSQPKLNVFMIKWNDENNLQDWSRDLILYSRCVEILQCQH